VPVDTRQLEEISPRKQTHGSRTRSFLWICLYLILIGSISRHLYKTPVYNMDFVGYMGNALLIEDNDLVRVHANVYSELDRWVPGPAREHLRGHDPGAPEEQNKSRQLRVKDPYRFAEFLPFYAIRPLYNRVLLLVSKTGLGLVRSTVFISAAAFFCLAMLLMAWMQKYVALSFAVVMASLVMICPPVMAVGRETTSDALATLVAFSALYLIFEKRSLLAGLIVLLGSLYFRTDFVVLAGPVLLACWLEHRLKFWQATALAAVAVGSVLSINHFAGDYGIQMLYYRNFIGTPMAPAETAAHFSVRDYISALRSGLTSIAGGFFLPFLLAGVSGLFRSPRARTVAGVTMAYALLHFLVLPNWQERWFTVFYLSMGLSAAMALKGESRDKPLVKLRGSSVVAGAA
jgi:hypothetical protein